MTTYSLRRRKQQIQCMVSVVRAPGHNAQRGRSLRAGDKAYVKIILARILKLAQTLPDLTGRQFLLAACEMHFLLQSASDAPEDVRSTFILLESDCHDLPIYEEFRALCSPVYLEEKEVSMIRLADAYKADVRANCNKLIEYCERFLKTEQ